MKIKMDTLRIVNARVVFFPDSQYNLFQSIRAECHNQAMIFQWHSYATKQI